MRSLAVIFISLFSLVLSASTLPERNLRGYGLTRAEQRGNDVVITAESSEKAGLWAARYDHVYAAYRVRNGVYRLPGGGWTRLALKDNTLMIRYSQTEPSGWLAEKLPEIPFYMNAWDDHPFRFYYRQKATPPSEKYPNGIPWKNYDPQGEFDFAKKEGAGLVFWACSAWGDTARGFDDTGSTRWAMRMAEAQGIPVVLNTNGGAPMWALDAHREEQETGAPDYLGGFHRVGTDWSMSVGKASWASKIILSEVNDVLANVLRNYNTSNVIDFLEPQGELNHGDFTVFIEYGPVVNASYREYLKAKYGKLSVVAKRWDDNSLKSWDDVRLPEIAEFAGFGPDAIDLKGTWQYRAANQTNEWGVLQMPGHALGAYLPLEPAVMKRTFDIPEKKAGERMWLYVWDLTRKQRLRVSVILNGKRYDDFSAHANSHWMVRDVTDVLKSKNNEITLELPMGKMCYKIYLSHEAPQYYPHFDRGKNAKWVDFCGWQEWSRSETVRKGLDALRAVEPDKGIVSMSPMAYFNTLREIAGEYGTRFHDTGGMAAFWWELLPMLMHSKGLPFSLEPGGPADDREGFRRMTNFYMSEGVNAIHYFIHLGCVLWNPEIRDEFEKRLPALMMLGKICPPENKIAMVVDSNVNLLMGYPWRTDVASAYPSGYMTWRFAATLGDSFQLDAITPYDFSDGNASRYRVLLDANNTQMDAEQVAGIERYVRAGGTYIAMFQSGRHAPTKADAWQLRNLAGVVPQWLSQYEEKTNPKSGSRGIELTSKFLMVSREAGSGASDFRDKFQADGAGYRVLADDVKVLWRWEDGTPAVTSRRIGKGQVISFGIRPHNVHSGYEWCVLRQIIIDAGIAQKPISMKGGRGFARHYMTTDGLYDIWYADTEGANDYTITFRDSKEREIIDVVTGKPMKLKGHFENNDFMMGKSLRGENEKAAWRWVNNQFGWWRGRPMPKKLSAWQRVKNFFAKKNKGSSPLKYPNVLPLMDGWHSEVSGTTCKLEPRVVGLDVAPSNDVLKRTFTVPKDWNKGDIELWATGMHAGWFTEMGQLGIELDGKVIRTPNKSGVTGVLLPVKPGETHELTFNLVNDNHMRIRGFGGPCYLYYRPYPEQEMDLSGTWEKLATFIDPKPEKVTLPGKYEKACAFRRSVVVPAEWKGKRVRFDYTSLGDGLTGVIVNGRLIRRHHHRFGDRTDVDITPAVKFGAENEFVLVGTSSQVPKGEITQVRLKMNEK